MAALRGGTILARCNCAASPVNRPSPRALFLRRLCHNEEILSEAGTNSATVLRKSGFLLVEVELNSKPRKLGLWPRRRVSDYRASSYSTTSSRSAPGNGRRPPSSSSRSPRPPPRAPPRSPPTSKDAREESWRSATSREEKELERFFATCPPGLEEIVAAELRSALIGATGVEVGSSGVSFHGVKRVGVLANLWLRSATRVLLELASGPLPTRVTRISKDPVYEFVRQAVDWPTLLVDDSGSVVPRKDEIATPRQQQPLRSSGSDAEKCLISVEGGRRNQFQRWKFKTFSVSSRVWDCDGVTSSMFASTRAKDAICDAVKDACGGSRPDPPEDGGASADVPLFLSLYRDHAVLYRDMTGVSLHKRGYRDIMHKAGLNEAVAAAMLTLAGWNRGVPELESSNKSPGLNPGVLMDPMCGSGTLLIEAALMAVNSAPGLMRSKWPFESWHDFHPSLLKNCREDAIAAEISAPKGLRLLGNDVHEGALSLCKRDAEAANVRAMLELSCRDCRDYSPSATPSLVVVNPPWGARLGDTSDGDDDESLITTWQALGRFLKTHCSQADVYVLSGNSTVTRAMHMKADKRWPVSVGGIDCRIMHYYVLPPKDSRTLEPSLKVANLT
ncbi:unnamed protein product [Calypogeia fissa]